MRRLSARFVAVGAVAVLTSTLTSAATATPAAEARTAAVVRTTVDTAPDVAGRAKPRLTVRKSARVVQPGISRLKLTITGLKGKGLASITIASKAGTVAVGAAKVKKGRATYRVPGLTPGRYKAKAAFNGRKGTTTFKVYNSSVAFENTHLTCRRGDVWASTPLAGPVTYKGKPAKYGSSVDIYLGEPGTRHQKSPTFLSYVPVNQAHRADFGIALCHRAIFAGAVSRTPPLANGTYTLQVYYTPERFGARPDGYARGFRAADITITIVP